MRERVRCRECEEPASIPVWPHRLQQHTASTTQAAPPPLALLPPASGVVGSLIASHSESERQRARARVRAEHSPSAGRLYASRITSDEHLGPVRSSRCTLPSLEPAGPTDTHWLQGVCRMVASKNLEIPPADRVAAAVRGGQNPTLRHPPCPSRPPAGSSTPPST